MAQTQAAQHKHLPGDLAVWFFIFAELAVFGILFIGFGVARSLAPATFSAGRAALHPWTGLINTIGLITASYLVACAVKRLRHEKTGTTALLVGAIAASSIYTFGKLWEYGVLYADGYNLGTDTFFMFYFFLTFFHFMHVGPGPDHPGGAGGEGEKRRLPHQQHERHGIRRVLLAHGGPGMAGAIPDALCTGLRR